jgi:hypothetical protein
MRSEISSGSNMNSGIGPWPTLIPSAKASWRSSTGHFWANVLNGGAEARGLAPSFPIAWHFAHSASAIFRPSPESPASEGVHKQSPENSVNRALGRITRLSFLGLKSDILSHLKALAMVFPRWKYKCLNSLAGNEGRRRKVKHQHSSYAASAIACGACRNPHPIRAQQTRPQ